MTATADPLARELLSLRQDSYVAAVATMVRAKLAILRERRNAGRRDVVRDAIGVVFAVTDGDDDALAALLDPYTSTACTVALIRTLAAIPSVLADDTEELRAELSELALAAANPTRDGRAEQ